MIIYPKDTHPTNKKLLEQINEFSKVVGYKYNIFLKSCISIHY